MTRLSHLTHAGPVLRCGHPAGTAVEALVPSLCVAALLVGGAHVPGALVNVWGQTGSRAGPQTGSRRLHTTVERLRGKREAETDRGRRGGKTERGRENERGRRD